MQASQLPTKKFPIPFANNAGTQMIRAIPQPSQAGNQLGAASLYDGFPASCFTPTTAGGIPPFGADFNGLLNQVTAWVQWQNAGGLVPFDSTFCAQIGGYPSTAALASATTPGRVWVNTEDNNTNNPDTTSSPGNGWLPLMVPADVLALIASKAPAGTITGTGWWRDPTTGFTVEWGTTTVVSASGYQNVTFPRAFTTLFSVIASDNGASSWSTSNATFNGVGAPSPTSFQAQCASWNGSAVTRNVNVTFGWHAFGLS